MNKKNIIKFGLCTSLILAQTSVMVACKGKDEPTVYRVTNVSTDSEKPVYGTLVTQSEPNVMNATNSDIVYYDVVVKPFYEPNFKVYYADKEITPYKVYVRGDWKNVSELTEEDIFKERIYEYRIEGIDRSGDIRIDDSKVKLVDLTFNFSDDIKQKYDLYKVIEEVSDEKYAENKSVQYWGMKYDDSKHYQRIDFSAKLEKGNKYLLVSKTYRDPDSQSDTINFNDESYILSLGFDLSDNPTWGLKKNNNIYIVDEETITPDNFNFKFKSNYSNNTISLTAEYSSGNGCPMSNLPGYNLCEYGLDTSLDTIEKRSLEFTLSLNDEYFPSGYVDANLLSKIKFKFREIKNTINFNDLVDEYDIASNNIKFKITKAKLESLGLVKEKEFDKVDFSGQVNGKYTAKYGDAIIDDITLHLEDENLEKVTINYTGDREALSKYFKFEKITDGKVYNHIDVKSNNGVYEYYFVANSGNSNRYNLKLNIPYYYDYSNGGIMVNGQNVLAGIDENNFKEGIDLSIVKDIDLNSNGNTIVFSTENTKMEKSKINVKFSNDSDLFVFKAKSLTVNDIEFGENGFERIDNSNFDTVNYSIDSNNDLYLFAKGEVQPKVYIYLDNGNIVQIDCIKEKIYGGDINCYYDAPPDNMYSLYKLSYDSMPESYKYFESSDIFGSEYAYIQVGENTSN